MTQPPPPSRTPFTRISSDPALSDVYDKLSSSASQTDQNTAAIAQQQAKTQTTVTNLQKAIADLQGLPANNKTSVLGVRFVTLSAYMLPTDHTIIFLIGTAAVCTLPNCRLVPGQTFAVKCDAASGAAVTLNSQGTETVDGAAANTISLAAGKAIQLQSDGQNWIILSRIP